MSKVLIIKCPHCGSLKVRPITKDKFGCKLCKEITDLRDINWEKKEVYNGKNSI